MVGLLFFFGLVTTSAQLEVEPNNAFSDANEINFAEEIQGSFASSNDYDYYKVTLAKLQKVTVSFWTTDRLQTFGKVTASIYNSDKVLISSIKSTSPNKIDNVFMANVGELFIKVSRSSVGVDDNLSYFLFSIH